MRGLYLNARKQCSHVYAIHSKSYTNIVLYDWSNLFTFKWVF